MGSNSSSNSNFNRPYRLYLKSYIDSDVILERSLSRKDLFNSLFNNPFFHGFYFPRLLFPTAFIFQSHEAVQPNSENLAVQPDHEKPIFYEVGFAQNTISKTGNSLQGMGYTQNLRWVLPNEKGHAQSITNLTGNSLQGMGYTQNLRWVIPNINYLLGNIDVKIMKNLTIILIGCMTLVLMVLAMLTLSTGSLTLKCASLIYFSHHVEP